MHHHQEAISGQKIRQQGIFFRAGHQLVHGVNHGLQPLQPLNAIDHCGLAYIDADGSACRRRQQMAQHSPPGTSRQHQPSNRADRQYPEKQPHDERNDEREHTRRRRSSRFRRVGACIRIVRHPARLSPSGLSKRGEPVSHRLRNNAPTGKGHADFATWPLFQAATADSRRQRCCPSARPYAAATFSSAATV